jgi:hypothetical protein
MFNNDEYYMVKEFENPPYYMKHVYPNKFIDMHEFHPDAYLRARYCSETDIWNVVDTTTSWDQLFLLKSHCKYLLRDLLVKSQSVENIPPLPPIIRIKKDQKFTLNGIPVNIKTVGAREYNKCFFSVHDFCEKFGYNDLVSDIQRSNTSQKEGFDYVFFMDGKRKVIYFTYYGILRQFFIARKKSIEHFIDWVCSTLFAVQMGTKEQRARVSAKVIGIDLQTTRELFNKSCFDLPYIYLFSLGTAADLRKSMKIPKDIPDHFVIYKWGRCKSLRMRTKDHHDEFTHFKGVKLKLITYGFVDCSNHGKAEQKIARFFKSNSYAIEIPKKKDVSFYKELAAFDPKIEKDVIDQYELVVSKYRGSLDGLNTLIEEYKGKIALAKEQLSAKDEDLARAREQIRDLTARLDRTVQDLTARYDRTIQDLTARLDRSEERAVKAEQRAADNSTELISLLREKRR